jgi:glycosyltransferase involved in cell wall biosynthesis
MIAETIGVSVVVPAYNEEGAIDGVLAEIEKAMAGTGMAYEIVAVDDGSTDQTGAVLSRRDGVTLVTHPENRGYGAALKSGILKARGEVIVITDADGSYPNDEIPRLLAVMDDCEMAVGARTGGIVNVPLLRRSAKWVLGKLANYLSGRKIPDLNSGLRAFRKETCLKFLGLISDGFSFTTTLTLAMLSNGCEVKFLPINYYKRTGKSKIKPVRELLNFALLIVRVITYFNPLKVFLPSSAVLLLVGLGYGLYQVVSPFHNLGEAPVLLILMGVQLLFLGLLADLIAKRFR